MTNFLKLKKIKILLSVFLIFIIACYFLLQFQFVVFKVCFSSKTWAHRVNSIEKYQEAKTIFSGIETDVFFDSLNNYFDVNHPPAKSINLKLYDFLSSNKNNSEFGFWLDFKNLDSINYKASLTKLKQLTNILKLEPHSIIIESTNPQYLDVFTKKGFKTSYYLPSNVLDVEAHEITKLILHTNKLLNSESIQFISASSNHYDFMRTHFPNTKKLTWILNEPPEIRSLYTLKRSFINFRRNLSIFTDSNIEVVLFKFESKLGNR